MQCNRHCGNEAGFGQRPRGIALLVTWRCKVSMRARRWRLLDHALDRCDGCCRTAQGHMCAPSLMGDKRWTSGRQAMESAVGGNDVSGRKQCRQCGQRRGEAWYHDHS
eukprot:FR743691.1.p2 GENE.FR743691.1~~FR743691.1.p2  ORF type:complete len:108 (+),score=0.96 FR743691.1:106-429(+)